MLHQNKHIKEYLFYEHASQNRAMQWPKKNHNLHEHIDNVLFSSPAPYLSDTLDSCPVCSVYQFYGSLVPPFITLISCKQYWSVSLGTAMEIEQCHANILL